MSITNIIIIVSMIAFSAFFSASETAISSVNRIRLKNMAENGNRGAKRALSILNKYDKALTTILIGNNIVNIACSATATIVCIALVGEKYGSLVSTIATTVVVLIFGEVMPKSIAKDHAETVAIGISAVIKFLMIILTPFSALFILLKKGVSKLFKSKDSVSVTEEELMAIIDEIEDEGVLEQQESNLVRSALEFDEITVDEIITPRVRIVAVECTDSAEEVREKFLSEQYSRMPVYDKTLDNIIGIINEKDFIRAYEESGSDLTVRSLIQETIYFPHLLKISEVMRKMQKKKCHMSVVLDQHGGTLGIVTMEDLLEELVGEIYDESDEVTSPITALSETEFEAYGDVSLNSLRRYFSGLGVELDINCEAHTVAGWVLELFGSIPKNGDVYGGEGFEITVTDAADLRINKVRIRLAEENGNGE
ncbi:MAG: HlyC/CorC family transporter [Oscillospiraceae bacterium]|nr:HlyC/CorC family transporter [Oscillospiraceae bacterium]